MNKYLWWLILGLVFLLTSSVVGCKNPLHVYEDGDIPLHVYEDGDIMVGGDGEPLELINNPNATDPTYAELIAFIKEDSTDEKPYRDSTWGKASYVCSDFAEEVHNNAETAGIRAAWVSIHFEGSDRGHACNAFETTDRGLVYIDCTGEGFEHLLPGQPTNWDFVAYVEIGKEYGVIDIAKATSLSYSFYEEYNQKRQEYEKLVSDYTDDITRYNKEINGKIYIEGSPELARIEAWEERLRAKSDAIDELKRELGDFCKPLGVVKDIYIHWGGRE